MNDRPSPVERLAEAVGGRIIGPNSIEVGEHLIAAYPSGSLRVPTVRGAGSRGVLLGQWNEDTDVLADRFRLLVDRLDGAA